MATTTSKKRPRARPRKKPAAAVHHKKPRSYFSAPRKNSRTKTRSTRYVKPRRHYSRQHRNPGQLTGMVKTALWVSGGAVAAEYAMAIVPASISSMGGTYGALVIKAGVGYLLGVVARKAGLFTPANAQLIGLGGFVASGLDLFNILKGKIPAMFQSSATALPAAAPAAVAAPAAPAQLQDPYYDGRGIRDLMAVRTYGDTYYGPGSGMGSLMAIRPRY